MQQYQEEFNALLGVNSEPNRHELALFERARKYIQKLSWIPGIEMIAVSNSLSMYATHEDSDIDLFIVTAPQMIWFVRFFVTLRLWRAGVWRHGDDIAGNFCLSFFVTTKAMNLEKIAIKDDIYLYYWIYHLKPVFVRGGIYEDFLRENSWVVIPEHQEELNKRFILPQEEAIKISFILQGIDKIIRGVLRKKTVASYKKLGRPEGIIISDDMLKFNPKDRRESIRDAIVKKNFDK